jgi:hypothetical protein
MTDTRITWFNLRRHDGPTDPPADPPTDPPADPPADPAADQLGDAGKKALQEERAARKAAEKLLAERDAKLKEFEDRDKTDAEKLAEGKKTAEARAAKATARAVAAEVRAHAGEFADPSDTALLGDLSKYVNTDGDIDTDAIKTDLAALLESKPHLKKAAAGPRGPAPDPSQGRGGDNGPTDFSKASAAEFAAELGKYGLRPKTFS